MKKVIVIGAGPAGLMAAGQAALSGAEVIILEKMPKPALKLGITGKGRCNITNGIEIEKFVDHIPKNFRFLKHALYSFNNRDLLKLFSELGVCTIMERGNRVFPASSRAADVCQALISWVKKNGVKIILNTPVNHIIIENNKVMGVSTKQVSGRTFCDYRADVVIVATGGASYPKTGSTGDGYKLAEQLGHSIETIRSALVPLDTKESTIQLEGLSLTNVLVSLWVDNKKVTEAFGEMIFTHFGLSGPIIITLSRYAVEAVDNNKKVRIEIDLKPALELKQLDKRLIRDFVDFGKKQIRNILKELLPGKMIKFCLNNINLHEDKLGSEISSDERKRLKLFLKHLQFNISGHRGLSEAIVTAGGVDVKEINSKTMSSKLVDGLYFAGEVMDVDANTGGYNLQIAFSTGWIAGNSI